MNISEINFLALIAIVVLVGFAISGFNRGFVKLFISLISMLLTFYLVWTITPTIAEYLIENTTIYENVKESLDNKFADQNSVRDNTIYENQVETINSYDLPSLLKESLLSNNNEESYQLLVVTIFEDYVSAFLARMVIKISAFLVTYIMTMIFLKMTFLSMEIIAKIPIISGINRLAGLFFGVLEGFFIVNIGLLVIAFVLGDKIIPIIFDSRILRYMYDNNIILRILIN